MTMARIVLRAGYDFARKFQARLDGVAEDVSSYTIEACLKNEAKTAELITDTAQTNTGGASWATGDVIIRFPASATTGLAAGNAWIEVAIIAGSERFPVEDIPVVIEAGYAL